MDFNKGLKDKWFILPVIALLMSLLIKVYWTFMRLKGYPFEYISDAGNHILYLFFLAKYGFHQLVPNYWNGFILFKNYPPGWHFLSLPLYYLTGDAVSATFLSLIQSLGLGFLFIFILGHLMRISVIRRLAFFLLYFANPVALDYIHIGRYPELTGWILFIPFFILIIWYKSHRIDKKFLLFIPLYSSIILTHAYVLVPASFLIISLFLVKKFKERIIIVLSFILSLILTSFWWWEFIPFVLLRANDPKASFELLQIGSIISYNTIILFSFLALFYFYYNSCRDKKRVLLFYSPLLILSLLILTRLIVFIPALNIGWIMPYNMFFLFICIYLFFNINFKILPEILRKLLPALLIALSISMLLFSTIREDYSSPASLQSTPKSVLRSEILSTLPEIEGRYMLVTTERLNDKIPHRPPKMLDTSATDYAIIHYNLSTPFGTIFPGSVPEHMKEAYTQMYGFAGALEEYPKEIKALDCGTVKDVAVKQNVRSLLAADEDCEFLKKCGFKEKIKKERVCLFIYERVLP